MINPLHVMPSSFFWKKFLLSAAINLNETDGGKFIESLALALQVKAESLKQAISTSRKELIAKHVALPGDILLWQKDAYVSKFPNSHCAIARGCIFDQDIGHQLISDSGTFQFPAEDNNQSTKTDKISNYCISHLPPSCGGGNAHLDASVPKTFTRTRSDSSIERNSFNLWFMSFQPIELTEEESCTLSYAAAILADYFGSVQGSISLNEFVNQFKQISINYATNIPNVADHETLFVLLIWQLTFILMNKYEYIAKYLPSTQQFKNQPFTTQNLFQFAQSKPNIWKLRFEPGWSGYSSQVYFFSNDMHDSRTARSLQFLKITNTSRFASNYQYMYLELREWMNMQNAYKQEYGMFPEVVEWIDYGGTLSLSPGGEGSSSFSDKSKIKHITLHDASQGFDNHACIKPKDSSIWDKILHLFGIY